MNKYFLVSAEWMKQSGKGEDATVFLVSTIENVPGMTSPVVNLVYKNDLVWPVLESRGRFVADYTLILMHRAFAVVPSDLPEVKGISKLGVYFDNANTAWAEASSLNESLRLVRKNSK